MNLISFVITLIVVGVLLWLLNNYGGQFIDGMILKIINIVVIIAVILWCLKVFGVLDFGSSVQVPRVN